MSACEEYLSVGLAGQTFGIPVPMIRDVLGRQKITRIPLAAPEVAGASNLRGHVVTVIDLRVRLGFAQTCVDDDAMSVVVERDQVLYSLLVDSVGEVLTLDSECFDRRPEWLDSQCRDASVGVYRLDEGLLVALDVPELLRVPGGPA